MSSAALASLSFARIGTAVWISNAAGILDHACRRIVAALDCSWICCKHESGMLLVTMHSKSLECSDMRIANDM